MLLIRREASSLRPKILGSTLLSGIIESRSLVSTPSSPSNLCGLFVKISSGLRRGIRQISLTETGEQDMRDSAWMCEDAGIGRVSSIEHKFTRTKLITEVDSIFEDSRSGNALQTYWI
mmetsp:Transcript_20867/g.43858  ORF Transcript_20867/g.43858 Transcript_20867/m.43858 type:complete len:118 (-) Transcript_20867:93-446(-)